MARMSNQPLTARGRHVLVKLPPKQTEKGGIALPDNIGTEFTYGRVVSAGEDAKNCVEGDVIAFDAMGQRAIELDPHKASDLVIITEEMVFLTIDAEHIKQLELPLP